MKKVKLVLWIIIIGFFGLAVYQNQDFFLSRHSLGINLYFNAYRTIELPNAVLFAAFFLIGWLIAYIFGLSDRYQASRTIKSLRQTTTNQQNALDALKNDIAGLKTKPNDESTPDDQTNSSAVSVTEEVATQKE